MELSRVGNRTIEFKNLPKIEAAGSVAGKKEKEGPLGGLFDATFTEPRMGKKTFEQAEGELLHKAAEIALKKSAITPADVDVIFGGDLLNQCIAAASTAERLASPFIGLYGACSTMTEGLMLASLFVDGGYAKKAMAMTSSHFCSAERQYRFPLEYGGQRSQNAQWTVTGAGAAIVSTSASASVAVRYACPGRVVDLGITDASNMGAAMAPSAADTLVSFFRDTKTKPEDYCLIASGDLGLVGSSILKELVKQEGFTLDKTYNDCGLMIFDLEKQDVHAGGSGCGCSASVLCAKILPEMAARKLKKVLFMSTGALMSPTSSQQGGSVAGVSHLVMLEATGK